MENISKIKKLYQSKAQKMLARSEMTQVKATQKAQQSFAESTEQECQIYLKNLNLNRLQVYKTEKDIDMMLKEVNSLPEIQKFLQKVWGDYLNDLEKEEEEFLQACYQGDLNTIRKFTNGLNKHPLELRNLITAEGKNGIHLATISGSYKNTEAIKQLAAIGVDINAKTTPELRTPLMLASILGNEVALRSLVDLKADTLQNDFQGNTALHLACIYGREDIVKILLQYFPPLEVANQKGLLPIQCSQNHKIYLMLQQSMQKNGQTLPSFQRTNHCRQINESGNSLMKLGMHEKKEVLHEILKNTNEAQTIDYEQSFRSNKIKQVSINEKIDFSCFEKISLLGKGAFGQVYQVKCLLDNRIYAMKSLDKKLIMRQNILRYAMTEKKILSTVRHPFIVSLHYSFQTASKLYLVMDYCPGGDMLTLIKERKTLSQNILRKYIAQIVLALEALHKVEIIYRDLKPGNVIFDAQGHACLTDFGLSKQASLSHSFCGSTAYLAPQMLWRRGHTKVLDWYLLGVLIYESLNGKPPFWDPNREKLLSNIKSGRYKPLSSEYSREVKDLVEKLMKSNSSKRLGVNGVNEIKNHAWFKQIDWNSVQRKEQVMDKLEVKQGKPVQGKWEEEIESLDSISNSINGWDYAKPISSIQSTL